MPTITVPTITVRTATTATTERVGEVLHLWALAPATVGACCVAADRGRARVPEFAAAALMLVAMADVGTGARLIAPVLWALLLVVGAMGLAALRGARRPRPAAGERMPHPSRAMTVMTALGLVVMAALMITMGTAAPSSAADAGGGHGHGGLGAVGGGLGMVVALTTVVAAGYVAVSAVAAVRSTLRLDRVQYVSMAAATALMAAASAA